MLFFDFSSSRRIVQMVAVVVLISMIVLALGYRIYGRWLARYLDLDDTRPTPACAVNDGVDFVPARKGFLLGQHFSAIAAAGPIVGPILAGIWVGWVPPLLWVLLRARFIGGGGRFFAPRCPAP